MESAETDALLTNEPQEPVNLNHRRRKQGAAIGAGVVFLLVVVYLAFHSTQPHKVRGVILMISDGFGPASQTMARNYYQYIHSLPNNTVLPLDQILVGSSRTRSSSSFVTDSAAGATAFACALKTYNGAIAVDPQGKPCGTVLEAAKESGMLTALVATSRITHATPASFAAHVGARDDEADIALQEIGNYTLGRSVDLMFGGGKCFFLPNSTAGSCRQDNIDVFEQAATLGWSVGHGMNDFNSLTAFSQLPLMNLFALDHMNYDIDRDPAVQPSLQQMAIKALEIIEKASIQQNKRFFMMIEGSRIDMAAHSNDPASHVHDILAYNDAIDSVKKFVEKNPDVVMISVSDHETGGFSVAHQLGTQYPEYNWFPNELVPVRHSGEYIAQQLYTQTVLNRKDFIHDIIFKKWLGITKPDPKDIEYLSQNLTLSEIDYYVGRVISDRAGLGWATHGHSAVDVNLYAYGAKSEELRGNHENTDIGDFIVRNLDLDLSKITQKLQS
ncbi:alkaline-phosphatase-like protein [Globomyces pollinis-pini]|nr:alkaline-phosphatase-like protein [Globomyces pollinis-pini]